MVQYIEAIKVILVREKSGIGELLYIISVVKNNLVQGRDIE